MGSGIDQYLAAGTRVRLDSFFDDSDEATPEYGIVVHCWRDTELDFHNCYIAFFGDGFPDGEPNEMPYMLRYAAVSLTVIT
jgi:hypothetical protein